MYPQGRCVPAPTRDLTSCNNLNTGPTKDVTTTDQLSWTWSNDVFISYCAFLVSKLPFVMWIKTIYFYVG